MKDKKKSKVTIEVKPIDFALVKKEVIEHIEHMTFVHLLFAALMEMYEYDERPFAGNFKAFLDYISEDKLPEWTIEAMNDEDDPFFWSEKNTIIQFKRYAAEELSLLISERLDD